MYADQKALWMNWYDFPREDPAHPEVYAYTDEMSYEEIAVVLECSVSATKSLIHRGRETLKELLRPYLRTGTWKEERTKL